MVTDLILPGWRNQRGQASEKVDRFDGQRELSRRTCPPEAIDDAAGVIEGEPILRECGPSAVAQHALLR
jgi:hypothetical protein